ncbi:MAG TPA: DUF3488 and transglutaminase-like domain-containing protein [Actinomycetota bacterium]|nr:DUF3488 and transglutaminase-like domain-containing protein [Actinomycetota bacterium]
MPKHLRPDPKAGSLWRDDTGTSPAALAALVCLGIVAVASLSRAFTNDSHLPWTIPALALGAAAAVTIGRRSLGLAFALVIGGAALTLPALFVRELTVALLPTPSGLARAWELLQDGMNGMLREAAPVPVQTRFLVLLWCTGLILGFLGGSWVVVGRPIGAVVTALMVVGYAGSVGVGPGRNNYAIAAVSATMAFFLAEGRHRIASWSHDRPKLPVQLGIPTLIAVCLVATSAPRVLGDDKPVVDLRGRVQPRLVIIKPLSDVQRQLRIEPPIEVMRVRAARPTYWRLTGLDSYDGKEWVLEAEAVPTRNGPLPAPNPPVTGVTLEQQYSITSLLSPWLPAAFAASEIQTPASFDMDLDTSTLLLREESPGLKYTVRSIVPDRAADAGAPAPDRWSPSRNEQILGQAARPIVQAARTPMDRALAIETHFRKYVYDEKVPGGHSVERLQSFLAQRRGYCEQFAAAMTLMLRGLGIPARVGVGFLPGSRQAGEFLVSTDEAHAWVEANIAGAGWVIFDPTPGRGQPASQDAQREVPVTPTPAPAGQAEATPTPASAPQPDDPRGKGLDLPIAEILVAAVALGGIPGAKAFRRRRRSTQGVMGSWAELLDAAADLGRRPNASETPWEFWRRTFTGVPQPAAEAAAKVAREAVAEMYAPGGAGDGAGQRAWAAMPKAIGGLKASAPAWRRVLALYDPRTLIPPLRLPRALRPARTG